MLRIPISAFAPIIMAIGLFMSTPMSRPRAFLLESKQSNDIRPCLWLNDFGF